MGLSYALGMSDGGIYCIPLNLMPVNGKVTENSGLPNKQILQSMFSITVEM